MISFQHKSTFIMEVSSLVNYFIGFTIIKRNFLLSPWCTRLKSFDAIDYVYKDKIAGCMQDDLP